MRAISARFSRQLSFFLFLERAVRFFSSARSAVGRTLVATERPVHLRVLRPLRGGHSSCGCFARCAFGCRSCRFSPIGHFRCALFSSLYGVVFVCCACNLLCAFHFAFCGVRFSLVRLRAERGIPFLAWGRIRILRRHRFCSCVDKISFFAKERWSSTICGRFARCTSVSRSSTPGGWRATRRPGPSQTDVPRTFHTRVCFSPGR